MNEDGNATILLSENKTIVVLAFVVGVVIVIVTDWQQLFSKKKRGYGTRLLSVTIVINNAFLGLGFIINYL
jgi:hypothetical protein